MVAHIILNEIMEEEYEKCPNCNNGSVEMEVWSFVGDQFSAPDFRLEPCQDCEGSGEIRIEN